ncbi:phage/plasmid primase, P4 family [Bacillus infantis]|uniref:phage/plasmid primase, P4 family n=1 Tax=Bacillus infantis TaxID=324767 RepID=UPI003CE9A4BE
MSEQNINFSNIPEELKRTDQWVLWRLKGRGEKQTKVPCQINGKPAKSNDKSTWSTFNEVEETYLNGGFDGIGFVFSKEDPFIGIDIDKCIADGKYNDSAEEISKMMNSYTEISPSGKGIHIIVKGELPSEVSSTGQKNTSIGLEVYRHSRFFTFTGNSQNVSEVVERPDALKLLFQKYLPKKENKAKTYKKAVKNSTQDLSNAELWERMFRSANGLAIRSLCDGQVTNGDHSSTDLSLCNHLAFWTNKDSVKMDSMFRESGLYREKWDKQHSSDGRTYGEMTIENAIQSTPTVREDFQRESPKGTSKQKKQKKSFPKTDLGNAERLIDRHGENLRYCPPFASWFVWQGNRWLQDLTNEVELFAKETVRYMGKSAYDMENSDLDLVKHAVRSESMGKIMSMISLAKSEKGIPILPQELDSDTWKLNCENGTIDLKTGKLLPHNRLDLITKIAPVVYDPNAKCPNWIAFLKSIMKNDKGEESLALINYLQKIIGYSLTGDTTEQVMFFLYGSGRNGKSTFINTIKEMLGDYASQANSDTFMVRNSERINNDIAALKGARLVSTVESEKGKKLAESLIKQLTGGETIKARFMHKDFFEYLPQFKIFFTTNHMPNIDGTDTGIWRRIRLIPFTVTIPEEKKDKKLPEKLQAELPGILRWAVEGCLKYQKEGLGLPAEVIAATKQYRTEMDNLEGFLSECCTIEPAKKATTKDLWFTYEYWCRDNGEENDKLSKKAFLASLKEKMNAEGRHFEQVRIGSNGDRGYQGIGMLPPPEDASVQSAFKL